MRWTVNNIRPERERAREKVEGDKGAKSGRHRREMPDFSRHKQLNND